MTAFLETDNNTVRSKFSVYTLLYNYVLNSKLTKTFIYKRSYIALPDDRTVIYDLVLSLSLLSRNVNTDLNTLQCINAS